MSMRLETKEDFNNRLRQCKTCDDFETLQKDMCESGSGIWFCTKRGGQELNSIYTRIETLRSGRKLYSSYGNPIKNKDGDDCIAYDTVRNGTTKTVAIKNIYKYIYIS